MKTLFTLLFVTVGLGVAAQDAVYFANGNRVEARLVTASEEKIKFAVKKGENWVNYSFRRENVLLAFNTNGQYFILSELNEDPDKAQKQINDFINARPSTRNYDVLIRLNPLQVIPAFISYESDELVNYQTDKGKAASINKSELIGILYKDGTHLLLKDASEVAQPLQQLRPELDKMGPLELPKPAPAPAPEPVATKPAEKAPESAPVSTETTATPNANPKAKGKPSLNEGEYNEYREKGKQKVEEFSAYLNIITDKSKDADEKDKAIEQATKLFLPDATIEVASLNRKGTSKYKVRDYLTRVKLLPYSTAKVEWTEIQYISELTQATDGNYYGVISGQQTFIGYADDGQTVLYSDVTEKNVKVKLQSYQKQIEGKEQVNWEVLLGTIGVAMK